MKRIDVEKYKDDRKENMQGNGKQKDKDGVRKKYGRDERREGRIG